MAEKKRVRDAGTGRIVTAAEAKARPKETVAEPANRPSVERRLSIIEATLAEAGGPISAIYARLSS